MEIQIFLKKRKGSWRCHHFTYVYQQSWSYDAYTSWDMERDGHNFFVISDLFCPFAPLITWKINILKIWRKKTPGDISISHMCAINGHHMMYSSRYMKCNRTDFLSFQNIFFPFTPPLGPFFALLTTWKIKIYKNLKKNLEISSF